VPECAFARCRLKHVRCRLQQDAFTIRSAEQSIAEVKRQNSQIRPLHAKVFPLCRKRAMCARATPSRGLLPCALLALPLHSGGRHDGDQ